MKDGLEEIADKVETFIHVYATRLEKRVKEPATWIKQTIVRDVLKQRYGWERWIRTIRNHLGFLLGSIFNFSGGITPAAARRAIAFQSGFHTRLALHWVGRGGHQHRTTNPKSTNHQTRPVHRDNPHEYGMSRNSSKAVSTVPQWHEYLRTLGSRIQVMLSRGSFLFNDILAFAAAMCVAQNHNKDDDLHPLHFIKVLETFLPLASIAHAVHRTVRKLVTNLQKQQDDHRWKRRHWTVLGSLSGFSRGWQSANWSHPSEEEEDQQQQQEMLNRMEKNTYTIRFVTGGAVIGISTVMSCCCFLPGITLPMVAASVTGSFVMLDCLLDEVRGNWLDIVRRMSVPGKLKILQGMIHGLYQMLQREFLYPAQEALEELDSSFGSSDDDDVCIGGDCNNYHHDTPPPMRERLHQAVDQAMDIKVAWMLTIYGVLGQILWMNHNVLFSMIHGSRRSV